MKEAYISFSELYPQEVGGEETQTAGHIHLYESSVDEKVEITVHAETTYPGTDLPGSFETLHFTQDKEEVANQLRNALEFLTGEQWVPWSS